ncbi:ATP-dependent helicase [Vibrio parahaemolyticus]|nr:ATP-dependent helicase [Vibrio parahaemolyticus]
MKPTLEQISVKERAVLRKNLIVRSFAGTGKTTTTKYVIENICSATSPVLYLTFAVSNVDDALSKMGGIEGLSITNIHKLAFAAVGSQYSHKLGDMNIRSYKELLGSQNFDVPGYVKQAITNFINSTDAELMLKHVPTLKNYKFRQIPIQRNIVDLTFKMSKQVWSMMLDVNNRAVKIPHDAYLKLYCHRPETLQEWLRYRTVVVDEAQDQSQQVVELEKRYVAAGGHLMKVGDDHQNIYDFRGCSNGLAYFETDPTFDICELTQSFRFGERIAQAAKIILKQKGVEANLKGTEQIDTHIRPIGYKVSGRRAVIHRTSAGVLRTAISLYHHNIPMFVVGGLSAYFTKELNDFERLKRGDTRNLSKAFLKTYPTWSAVERIHEQTQDSELGRVIKVIKMAESLKIGNLDQTISHIDQVSAGCNNPTAILSTVHKFKGLEEDNVVLSDDFFEYSMLMKLEGQKLVDEINLLYVAITRAMKNLVANSLLTEFLRRAGQVKLITGSISPYA